MDNAQPGSTQPDGTTRRFFLGAAAGLTGAALAATAAHAQMGDAAVPPAAERNFTGGLLNLIIDGQQAGPLRFASGGAVSGEVVLEKIGDDGVIKKHLAALAFGEFDFQLGFPVSKPLMAEIDSMMQMTFDRFNGSVQTADFTRKVVSERRFTNALVTEVGFPALDAASKDPVSLTVKISPETIHRVKAGGTLPKSSPNVKQPLLSNFKLLIDGLDCKKVTRIEAFAVKLAVQKVIITEPRPSALEPLFLEIPDLKITLLESGAQTWFDWFEDFVVNGKNADPRERNGTLSLLTPDLKTALATISFSHLGIFELEPTDDPTSKDTIRKVTAQLYCEQMKFKLPTG